MPQHHDVPVLILAAGFGRRIAARTNGGPKALLEVGGRTLLDREIAALDAAGFRRVIVVTGHAADRIRQRPMPVVPGTELRLEECWNADYATTNNIVSMLAAGDRIADGFVLLNSDIVFDPSILVDVAARDRGSWLVVDGDEPLGAEEMKVQLDDAGTVTRISKGLDPAASAGEYIGILRFDAAGAGVVLRSARSLVAAGRTDVYYEDAVDAAAAELGARPLWTRGRAWTEIDDAADFERAVGVAAGLDAAGGASR